MKKTLKVTATKLQEMVTKAMKEAYAGNSMSMGHGGYSLVDLVAAGKGMFDPEHDHVTVDADGVSVGFEGDVYGITKFPWSETPSLLAMAQKVADQVDANNLERSERAGHYDTGSGLDESVKITETQLRAMIMEAVKSAKLARRK